MTEKHVFLAWLFRFTNNRQQCWICTTIPGINPHCLFWGCKGISSLLYYGFALFECFGVRLRFVFGHLKISRSGTLDWSYSRIKYAKICDHLNRYMHLNYLCSPDTWILPCNKCQNKWFSEWIPCIFGPEYGQSNAPKVKIRRPERSRSAVRPKIDPVSRAISTSTLASGQALHLWRARRAARKRAPRTCVPFRALLSRDFSRLPQPEILLAGYPNSWHRLIHFFRRLDRVPFHHGYWICGTQLPRHGWHLYLVLLDRGTYADSPIGVPSEGLEKAINDNLRTRSHIVCLLDVSTESKMQSCALWAKCLFFC